jgi:ribonuclease R
MNPKKGPIGRNQTGIVKRHPDGFGFFIPDDTNLPDVYISRHSMTGVMTNDRVEVAVFPEPGGNRFRGEILNVLRRATQRAMGQFKAVAGDRGLLADKVGAWGADLTVLTNGFEVKEGDWVAVQITSYPDEAEGFRGKVVAVIGDAEDPQNDSLRVLHANSIPFEFAAATLKEVAKFPEEVTAKDWQGRKDLRAEKFITIDGKTAKDFDDAILVQSRPQGFRLWVAIADVSHYVKPGTSLDDDAYERGTSTYFPSFVAPMLPEKLSNNLCSLVPHKPRLSLVAEMDFDFEGRMQRYEVYEAVIESHARVTYGEAEEVIEGHCPEHLTHVKQEILLARDLARILMHKRFQEGSLNLELPETVIELNDLGQPLDIMQAERLFAHRLIEEMMLSANVAVAKFLGSRDVPALYRIHESPDPDAIETFNHFLQAFGEHEQVSGSNLAKKLTAALQKFAGHPKEHILNMLALRSMSQAKYSPHNVGHFGLGFSDYAHFTSPIRRYPDLIIHRQLKSVLYPKQGYRAASESDLESAGTFLSACEQRSVKAERQINAIKKARFMSQHLGEEFEGSVSSVTKFGMFVILRQFDVDGLIRSDDLPGGPFELDEDTMRLVARRSGYNFSIGDTVTIQVAAADYDNGQIDFVLIKNKELIDRLEKGRENFKGKKFSTRSSRPEKDRGKKARGRQGQKGRNEHRDSKDHKGHQSSRRESEEKGRDRDSGGRDQQKRGQKKSGGPKKLSDMIKASSSQGLRFGKAPKKSKGKKSRRR